MAAPQPMDLDHEIIQIKQASGSAFIGSNSAFFEHQGLSDIYFSSYWGPPLFPDLGHARVHAYCPNRTDLFFAVQVNPEGGDAYMWRLDNGQNPIEWEHSEQAIGDGMLSLQDLGPHPFFVAIGDAQEVPPVDPAPVAFCILGDMIVPGFMLNWRNRGGYRHSALPGVDDPQVGSFIYHPHLERTDHLRAPEIDTKLRPGAEVLKSNKRPRPKRLRDVKIRPQVQSFRQNGTLPVI